MLPLNRSEKRDVKIVKLASVFSVLEVGTTEISCETFNWIEHLVQLKKSKDSQIPILDQFEFQPILINSCLQTICSRCTECRNYYLSEVLNFLELPYFLHFYYCCNVSDYDLLCLLNC
jgi:hypothetical protein